jgi:glycolate oxidase FAD binding subunit
MNIKDNDISTQLQQQVQSAIHDKKPLCIQGGKSKLFFGNRFDAQQLDLSQHTGIVSYEPTELCITVRAGTKLSELEALLAENNQILPFEPPHYLFNDQDGTTHDTATIGGAIATGISGPRRAYTGSARDAILGVEIINGDGDIVSFGGQVMKNVAGYDLSRLMVRSQGTLGILLSVSIKLLPKPASDLTLSFNATQDEALSFFQALRVEQLPVTASVWYNNNISLRLSASDAILKTSHARLDKLLNTKFPTLFPAEVKSKGSSFWQALRDHTHPFFTQTDKPIWRLSLPPATKIISQMDDALAQKDEDIEPSQLIEWGGAQRWIRSRTPANIIHSTAQSHGGYASFFYNKEPNDETFPALEPALFKIHQQLKNKMDPHHIFNPNKMYQGL